MEYRVWISIAEMPFREEEQWLPFIEHLEKEHPELGPIASWDDDLTMILVLASEQADRAAAAELAAAAVSCALHATALADRFPSVFRVEPVAGTLAA
jgi:hypothetical protein